VVAIYLFILFPFAYLGCFFVFLSNKEWQPMSERWWQKQQTSLFDGQRCQSLGRLRVRRLLINIKETTKKQKNE
jgi:hypothetical protein